MPCTPEAGDLHPVVALSGHFNPHLTDVEYGVLDGLIDYTVRRAQLHTYEDFVRSLQAWNITPPCFSVMTATAHNLNLKLVELANILGVARSNTVPLVDTLGDMGMVERWLLPKDKRAFRLVLTARGVTILDEIACAVTVHDARVAAHLLAGERQMLLALLNKPASGSGSTS